MANTSMACHECKSDRDGVRRLVTFDDFAFSCHNIQERNESYQAGLFSQSMQKAAGAQRSADENMQIWNKVIVARESQALLR